jgi:predicted TIM-barrel fold metal-dependent hydrolase
VQNTTYHDADSHFMEPFDWLDQADPTLASEMPFFASRRHFKEAIIGEVLALVPEAERPPASDLLPRIVASAIDDAFEETDGASLSEVKQRIDEDPALARFLAQKGSCDATERLEVNDHLGISTQIVSPSMALTAVEKARSLTGPTGASRMCSAYNTWAASVCHGHTDRLLVAALVDMTDVDSAVSEIRRTSRLGCKAFLPPMNPIRGRTLGDRAYDSIWRVALDLGMLPILHLGRGEVQLSPDWGRRDGSLDVNTYARMVIAQRAVVAQLCLSSMIYGGVFDRFPDLIVLCEEFGLAWVQNWLDHLGPESRDGARTFGGVFGWTHRDSPDEVLQRHLRFTPLPGQRVDQFIDLFGPDVALFCTDYPHPEGSADAAGYFHRQLDGKYPPETLEKFFSGNMQHLIDKIK